MNDYRGNLAWFALACVLVAGMPARAEVRGKVEKVENPEARREEWRRSPIADAYVTMWWTITIPSPAHATSSCRYQEVARTDDKGEFVIEGPNFITAGMARSGYSVYARGLEELRHPYGPGPKEIVMATSRRTPEERADFLRFVLDPPCSERALNAAQGVVEGYRRIVTEEASTIQLPPKPPPARPATWLDTPRPAAVAPRPDAKVIVVPGAIQGQSIRP
jgi:hypothetical protein